MNAPVDRLRFPGLLPPHLDRCSGLPERVAELASSFPLLFFMLVRECGPRHPRIEAARLAELGRPLADVAQAYGLPLCLRRIPPEACIVPPPWVRWSADAGRMLADHIPKSPLISANWLGAVFHAARSCNEAFGLWIAQQRQLFLCDGFDAAVLQPLALYAWHSCDGRSPLNPLAVKPWSIKLGIKSAVAETEQWLIRLKLFACSGNYPLADTWLDAGRVAGLDFAPLTSLEQIMAERVAMRNCLHTYIDKVARGACRLFAVRAGSESIASIEVVADASGRLRIGQMKGPGNTAVAADVRRAAQAWVRGQRKRRGKEAPGRGAETATVMFRRLFEPYRQATGEAESGGKGTLNFSTLNEQLTLLKRWIDAASALQQTPDAVRPARYARRQGNAVRRALRARLGDDIYASWFLSMEFESFDGRVVHASVPVGFLKRWIEAHHIEDLVACCAEEFIGAERIEIVLREPRIEAHNPPERQCQVSPLGPAPRLGRSSARFEGSPLDRRFRLDTFLTGPCNLVAHAAAVQIVQSALAGGSQVLAPVYIQGGEGLGKTHLQNAVAGELQRRAPGLRVLYMTAERFRSQFTESVKRNASMSFEETFSTVDILLVDDLEFVRKGWVERAFEQLIATLLDAGRRVVLASRRPLADLRGLGAPLRRRLQLGLIANLAPMDQSLRHDVLRKRVEEKRAIDPCFAVGDEVIARLAASRKNGRTLAAAVDRLFVAWRMSEVQDALGEG
jgi:chromosomal replication initiator protein